MAPPSKSSVSKKTETKKKEKIIEDKTFGIKNKKGAKQQKFIQQVEKQVKTGGVPPRKTEEVKKKDAKLKEAEELNMIFKPVPVQKIEKGADPKSVLCTFFKFGQCTKGNKCKFSHDLSIERKAEKRSLYVDMRDKDDPCEEDTMENWSEEKLKEVVEKKHGESDKKMPNTEIICKYFLEAVENSKYGWFWSCPTGSSCIYRHALPPGFVLKKDVKEEKKDVISLEEHIEKQRSALDSAATTKLTLETFLKWKKHKLAEKKAATDKENDKKRTNYKAGLHVGLSGRDMFSFNPELAKTDAFEDGDDAVDDYARNEDENDDGNDYKELDVSTFGTYMQPEDGECAATCYDVNEELFLGLDLDAELKKCVLKENK